MHLARRNETMVETMTFLDMYAPRGITILGFLGWYRILSILSTPALVERILPEHGAHLVIIGGGSVVFPGITSQPSHSADRMWSCTDSCAAIVGGTWL